MAPSLSFLSGLVRRRARDVARHKVLLLLPCTPIFMFAVLDAVIQLTASLAVIAVRLTVIARTTLSLFLGRPGPKSGTRQVWGALVLF